MLKELFEKQRRSLDNYFDALDVEKCEEFLELLVACEGVLFLTGVGKSGFIAQKLAATLMSTGTKSFFLPVVDALHGDLGMVSSEDTVLILSKSGKTEELLQIVPPLRNKGAKVLAMTQEKESQLEMAADSTLCLPLVPELCPFDLAPTTSTELQLLMGDALAVALMRRKGFSLDEFALNHPGGTLGRRMTMRVRDLMLSAERAPLARPEQMLQDVLVELSNKRCGCLVIVDEEKQLQGIFTDGDLRRALETRGEKVLQESLSSLMTPTPRSIDASSLAWEARQLMESDQKQPIMVLPVIEREEVVGLIKMHDLLQALG